MSAPRSHKLLGLVACTLTAMLAVQVHALVHVHHAVEHADDVSGSDCESCTLAKSVSKALGSEASSIVSIAPCGAIDVATEIGPDSKVVGSPDCRGPPLSLSA